MHVLARVFAISMAVVSLSSVSANAADVAKGKKVFNKCKACHAVDKPKNKVGPHLVKIMGRASAQAKGFKYSKAMKAADLVWDEKTLDAFLIKPKKFLKGSKMAYAGLKKAKDRANLIAYLKSLE
jgi:cytochrome c